MFELCNSYFFSIVDIFEYWDCASEIASSRQTPKLNIDKLRGVSWLIWFVLMGLGGGVYAFEVISCGGSINEKRLIIFIWP